IAYGQHGLINTENDLNATLLTGQMAYDIFTERNVYMNYRQTMARGYCLDLSGSEVIRQAVARMVPAVAEQLMVDGRIYGLPTGVQFDLLCADAEVFAQMGYDAADVPGTCGEFLSFLEAWIARQDADPEAVQVFGGWDYTVYDATTYTVELARLVLEEAIRQQQAAGEALSFSDPMLLDALTRVRQIGQALARVEPPSESMSAGEWRTNQPALFVRSDLNPWGAHGGLGCVPSPAQGAALHPAGDDAGDHGQRVHGPARSGTCLHGGHRSREALRYPGRGVPVSGCGLCAEP
ncbi:MAG: hypothetical protein ACI4MK_15625, partial [Aristaeellaceae bacterium]